MFYVKHYFVVNFYVQINQLLIYLLSITIVLYRHKDLLTTLFYFLN